MLFSLPDLEALYHALITRDAAYDGRAYVGVTSTGVFCRLTCAARKPKPQHCRFFETVAECLAAGFRPCQRCHPLAPAAEAEPMVQTLLTALAKESGRRWAEGDLTAMGLDPSTVRRAFKRHFGLTFLEMARLERLREGVGTLAGGGRVIDAQLDAGFESPAAFRAAFARLLGQSPGSFMGKGLLRADAIRTPLGPMIAVCDRQSLHLLEFADRKALAGELKRLLKQCRGDMGFGRYDPMGRLEAELAAYFAGQTAEFTVPLTLHGSAFTKSVWAELQKIPPGETRSYSEIAQAIGQPAAVRAVARANGANQIALLIPCHRVIGADGSLTGYGGGLWRKQKLIEIERQYGR